MSDRQPIEPRLIKRYCGGWLAVSPDGADIRLGVTAETEDRAAAEFHAAVARWREILAGPPPALGHAADEPVSVVERDQPQTNPPVTTE